MRANRQIVRVVHRTIRRHVLPQVRSLSALPEFMRAQVLTKAGKEYTMGLEELRMPEPAPTEVLIKTRACGVCHSDLHVMDGAVGFPLPAVMGHEISGEVVSVGSAVTRKVSAGQQVVVPFIMPCGTCTPCSHGRQDLCEPFFTMNRQRGRLYDGTTRLRRRDGTEISMYSMSGLAEYCIAPATAVFPLPAGIPLPDASIIGCSVFTAFGAIRHAGDVRAGESIAVIGTGGVGGNILQFARAFGCNHIIAIDVSDEKLKAMKKFGATAGINVSKEKVIDRIREITGGRGVDVCFEALGKPTTFRQATDAVADGGRAIMIGITGPGTLGEVELSRLVRRQITVRGSYGARAQADMPVILDFIAKKQVDLTSHITKRYSLADAGKAYNDLQNGQITGRAIIDMQL